MKFSCESHILAYPLKKCSRLARQSKTHPVARNVLIEATEHNTLRISATDVISAYVTYYVTTDVNVSKSGKVLVDAASLATFLDVIEGTVNAYVTATDTFIVKSNDKKISLKQDKRYMPEKPLPEDIGDPVLRIDGDDLSDLLGISFMADQHNSIAAVAGTYLMAKDGILHTIAASSFRFAKASLPVDYSKSSSFLLPQMAGRLLPYYFQDNDIVEIYAQGNTMWFSTHRFLFSCNRIEDKYPYQIIANVLSTPKPNSISIDKTELEQAVVACKELSRVSKIQGNRIIFDINIDDSMEVARLTISTSEESQIGELEWTIITDRYKGESFVFAINVDYLDDILTALNQLAKGGILADFEGVNLVNISAGEDIKKSAIFFSSNSKNSIFAILPMVM